MSRLTAKKKAIYLQIIIRRDGGFQCFYCRKTLSTTHWVYEHLNGNSDDSFVDNVVLAHQSCNLKKLNDFDMQFLAIQKLELNQKSNLSCERESLEVESPTMSPEMDISKKNFELTKRYLQEIINTDGSIEVKDTIDSSSMHCINKTGHGSPVAVRRYIDMLCSRECLFMITKNDDGERILVKRTGK
ncbi:MAG: hypothetical protein COA77_03200 [Thaumarchaeota archaeon]|nr:MAG: hypothetical protein COA77_03200 [Nitrososphaerota archaeon]